LEGIFHEPYFDGAFVHKSKIFSGLVGTSLNEQCKRVLSLFS